LIIWQPLFDLLNNRLLSLKSLTLDICDTPTKIYKHDLPVISRLEVLQLNTEDTEAPELFELLGKYTHPSLHTIRLGNSISLSYTEDDFMQSLLPSFTDDLRVKVKHLKTKFVYNTQVPIVGLLV